MATTHHANVILPKVSGLSNSRQINILLVNPNSSEYMTKDCLTALIPSLPSDVIVHGFTAPYPAPTAIESQTDAALSTEACIRAIKPIGDNYDAFLVACFRDHPLISVLKEKFTQPVLGIMEAAMYAARMLGSNMGIICTSERSAAVHGRTISQYGFRDYFAGCEAAMLGVLELDSNPKAEVHANITRKINRLVQEKGADCVLLGCAGMAEMRDICATSVQGSGARVLDGVGLGVQFLIGLVREGLKTSKNGIFRDPSVDRVKRMQDWL